MRTSSNTKQRVGKVATLEAKVAEYENSDKKLQMDDLIPVMSLLPYPLNLSTREGGQGNTRKFTRFGEIKKIVYRELIDIMENHANFLAAGYFYILDKSVIRSHGLEETYSKILTKEKLDEILALDSDEATKLFESCNAGQQEVITQLLIDKVRDNAGSINLNIVDKISRMSGIDIIKRAENEKEIAQTKE